MKFDDGETTPAAVDVNLPTYSGFTAYSFQPSVCSESPSPSPPPSASPSPPPPSPPPSASPSPPPKAPDTCGELKGRLPLPEPAKDCGDIVAGGDTTGSCGSDHVVLNWDKATIKYDNFGGHGRNKNDPAELRFTGVGKHKGKPIEVVITSRLSEAEMKAKCDFDKNNKGRGACYGEDASLWDYYGSFSIAAGRDNLVQATVSFLSLIHI